MPLHDLLPLPYTFEVVQHVARRIKAVQDFLGERILIENVSSYLSFRHAEMTEWEFVGEVLKEADCDLLLDVNNLYVSSQNHHFSPESYLGGIPFERIREIHLGAHEVTEIGLIDAHNGLISTPVWKLYELVIAHAGAVPTLIEWDSEFPAFSVISAEVSKAQHVLDSTAR